MCWEVKREMWNFVKFVVFTCAITVGLGVNSDILLQVGQNLATDLTVQSASPFQSSKPRRFEPARFRNVIWFERFETILNRTEPTRISKPNRADSNHLGLELWARGCS